MNSEQRKEAEDELRYITGLAKAIEQVRSSHVADGSPDTMTANYAFNEMHESLHKYFACCVEHLTKKLEGLIDDFS